MFKNYGGKFINLKTITHFFIKHFTDGGPDVLIICFVGGSYADIDTSFQPQLERDLKEV